MEEKRITRDEEQDPGRKQTSGSVAGGRTALVEAIISAPGKEAINRILDLGDPEQAIQRMNRVDFFWLVKKIGEEDSPVLLKLASPEQWEYLLDMELWRRDRIDMKGAAQWLGRLYQADPDRFAGWLFGEGESLAFSFFFRNIQVEVRNKDEAYDLTDDFITLDGVYYLRILDKENEETIRNILQNLARDDYLRYQALLVGLMGVLPAELEEEMYRLRNVRLAEDGFLPFEEALSVYAYLKHDALRKAPLPSIIDFPAALEDMALVPVTPLFHAEGSTLLMRCAGQSGDSLFLDRIRLEFAGLCNLILSADGLIVRDLDTLLGVCRKAAGLVNLGLEKASGGDLSRAEECLRSNPLVSVFRVGFGVTLELRWETERWLRGAWFARSGCKIDFWGDEWAGTLAGILERRPRLFSRSEGEIYRDFENRAQIEACRAVVHRMMVLDRLLEAVTSRYPLDKHLMTRPALTFQALLFTFWARRILSGTPAFTPLSEEEIRALFRILRSGEERPPYLMQAFREVFVEEFLGHMPAEGLQAGEVLGETLGLLWENFVEEYAWVAAVDLRGKFLNFILTEPS